MRIAFCLLTVNNMLPLNLIKSILKYRQAWCIMCRLKGPRSLLSAFCVCYKNNFGYKCLHSTNFILNAASLLSHPNKTVNTHAQTAFLLYFCNSKSPRTVFEIFLIGNDSAIIQTTNYNALEIPTPVKLVEKFPLHATAIKDWACSR